MAEEARELPQHPGIGRRGGHRGRKRDQQGGQAPPGAWKPQSAWSSTDQPHQDPGGQDQQAVLGFGDHRDRGHDQEDGAQQPVAAQGAAGEVGGLVGDDGDDRGADPVEQGL